MTQKTFPRVIAGFGLPLFSALNIPIRANIVGPPNFATRIKLPSQLAIPQAS